RRAALPLHADYLPGTVRGNSERVSQGSPRRITAPDAGIASPRSGVPAKTRSLRSVFAGCRCGTGAEPSNLVLPAAGPARLRAALADLAARYGADPAAWLTPAPTIHWTPLGAGSVPDTPWMNRGTYNQIVSLVPGRIRAENVVPPGESGDVRSPHFADQLRLYATWTYKPMRLTEDDLAGHETETITLPVS